MITLLVGSFKLSPKKDFKVLADLCKTIGAKGMLGILFVSMWIVVRLERVKGKKVI